MPASIAVLTLQNPRIQTETKGFTGGGKEHPSRGQTRREVTVFMQQPLNKQLAAPMRLWVGPGESRDSREFSKETAVRVSNVKDAKGNK
jgi:hypothetical protein